MAYFFFFAEANHERHVYEQLVETNLPCKHANGDRVYPFAVAMIRQGRPLYICHALKVLLVLNMAKQPNHSEGNPNINTNT